MKVICSHNDRGLQGQSYDAAYGLFASLTSPRAGRISRRFPIAVRRSGIRPGPRTWDFVTIAISVAAADSAISRSTSPDGWTRQIELVTSVLDPEFWTSLSPNLEKALGFLTGDIWTLSFNRCGVAPLRPLRRMRRRISGDCVCLFSGGADSLVGAIDLVSQGRLPLLVSQVASGDKQKQVSFARDLGLHSRHLQFTHGIRPVNDAERSQRSRSVVFLAYGLLAAMHLSENDAGSIKELIVPENGFVSLNVPLTPLRIGSLSTRTTHPYFLGQIQNIFNACEFPVKIVNPYQFHTKGEMFRNCLDPVTLSRLASDSTSCGKYGTHGRMHCGRCVPCLIRRSAFHASNVPDRTAYKFSDLTIANSQHLHYDDVKAIRYAIAVVNGGGLADWASGAISSAQLGSTAPFFSIANRGILEAGRFMSSLGI